MKREDIKRNNELKKIFQQIMKESAKEHKIKKIDYMLWTTNEKMFYELLPNAYIGESDLMPKLSVRISYKPLWADDLMWDILGMESNKKEPMSLRAIGAFTAPSVIDKHYSVELEGEDHQTVKKAFDKEILSFFERIKTLHEENYINEFLNSKRFDDVHKTLIYIHQNRIQESKMILQTSKNIGGFIISDKTYRELALEYLEKNNL